MREELRQLEKTARLLDPGPEDRKALLQMAAHHAETFLRNLEGAPAYTFPDPDQGSISDSPITEEPAGMDAALEELREHVDHLGANVPSGGHMGYIPGGGLYASALGDYLAAVSNRYAGIYFGGPGAVRLEHLVLRWLMDLVGYPQGAAGDLTSGGSIANLTGIVTARESHEIRSAVIPKTVVYLSEQAHHSVNKALRIAGLGECVLRTIRLDERFRMDVEDLDKRITEDREAGLRPWLVVASAGTTDTGAVDPLDAIADLAERYALWLHTDGAYGASFMLCEQGKKALSGIERSDSLVLDPHKGFFLPFGSGVALVRDGRKMQAAHSYSAHYMRDTGRPTSPDEISPGDLSPEMSKHFRGLRFWLPLKLHGLQPFRAALEEKLLLARYFHQEIQKLEGFEAGPYPDLSIVTYRYVPPRGDPNEFNEKLIRAVLEDGRVLLTSTVIDGRVILRAAILGFRTHLDTVDLALEVLREKAQELAGAAV
jgi:glutamate/tyrosine decarboxylase-like PLP-dependent enzyme